MAGEQRDFELGRISLITVEDSIAEQVGAALEAVGGYVGPGEAKPKGVSLTVPVWGTDALGTGQEGDRMRRQLRSLIDNPKMRTAGHYLRFAFDPQLSGWYAIGEGELAYADGGPGFQDYKLALSGLYKIGGRTTHRRGIRLEVADRRSASRPRDVRGTFFSVTFSGITAVVSAFLGARSTMVTGKSGSIRLVGPYFRTGREGSHTVIDGGIDTEMYAWEQPEGAINDNDCLILDRRGNVAERRNLVGVNPTSWGTAISFRINAAGASVASSSRWRYPAQAAQVTTTATPFTGIDYTDVPVVAGRGYRVRAYVRAEGAHVGKQVNVTLGDGTVGSNGSTVVLTEAWQLVTATLVPGASGITGMAARSINATAPVFYIADAMVEDETGYATSSHIRGTTAYKQRGPAPRVNRCLNPSFEYDTFAWSKVLGTEVFVRDASDVKCGSWSARVEAGAGGGIRTQGPSYHAAGEPGSTYTTSMWVKAPAGVSMTLAVNDIEQDASTVIGTATTVFAATGDWQRVSVTRQMAAGANAQRIAITSATAATFYVDGVLHELAAAVGTYFDGDSSCARFAGGSASGLPSVMGDDDQSLWGWEEVYGPNYPLSPEDVPVSENGFCRVRYDPSFLGFRLDQWAGDPEGWVERGTVHVRTDTGNMPSFFVSAHVVEWTPERSVVRARFLSAQNDTFDIYIIQQRGWLGARFEAYVQGPTTQRSPLFTWTPASPGNVTWTKDGQGPINSAGGWGSSTQWFTANNPGAILDSAVPGVPDVLVAVGWTVSGFIQTIPGGTTGYPTNRFGINFSGGTAPANDVAQFLSFDVAFADPGSLTYAQFGSQSLMDVRPAQELVVRNG
jgi:hypothetical protein